MSYRPWTTAEEKRLRAGYSWMSIPDLMRVIPRTASSIYQRARALGLVRPVEYFAAMPARKAFVEGGKRNRFVTGHSTWNKGTKYRPGGRAEETQFKKGNKPQTWRPIGSIRIDKDGYAWRKVADTQKKKRDWKLAHVILWEKCRGKIPRGKILVFKNRDKTDVRIGNLELVTRAENMRRNHIQNLPKPVKQAIYALNVLKRRIKNNGKY